MMTPVAPDVLEAPRLPALCRGVCLYAGLPLPPAAAPGERFVVRSGPEPPDLLARLLEEAFIEDGVAVEIEGGGAPRLPDPAGGAPKVAVRPGYGAACPAAEELRRAVAAEGAPVLIFAVERHDDAGRLLGVTWAAVPEEEPPPQGRFRAAVTSYECDPPGG
jgi:hypothetical protein